MKCFSKTVMQPYALTLLVSVVVHVVLVASLGHAARHAPPPQARHLVEVSMVQQPAPPPPPRLPALHTMLHPQVTPHAVLAPQAPSHARTPPQALPPPNQTPPADPPPKTVVPVFGINLSSTAPESSFAVPIGSTLMAEPNGTGPVRPYAVPEYEVSERPHRLRECIAAYPEEAKRQGVEGRVTLDVEVLENGHVGEVRLVKGLGHGLDEAAIEALKECRFRPAKLGDMPVPTRIQYVYNFIIEN